MKHLCVIGVPATSTNQHWDTYNAKIALHADPMSTKLPPVPYILTANVPRAPRAQLMILKALPALLTFKAQPCPLYYRRYGSTLSPLLSSTALPLSYTPVAMLAKGPGALSEDVGSRHARCWNKKRTRMLRVDHPWGLLPNANLRLLFAASILPTRPWRKIFIPRAASFRRDCGRRFSGVYCSGVVLAAL